MSDYYGRVATSKKPPPSISFSGTGGLRINIKKESPIRYWTSSSKTYIMKTLNELRSAIAKNATNNKVSRTIKANPVCAGVAATYIAGSTLAYTAAGVSVKTALAYSVGVCAVYGALGYGAYHLLKASK